MSTPPAPLRRGEIVRIRTERWRVVRHVGYGDAAIVDVAGCDTSNRTVQARFVLPFEPVTRLLAASSPRCVTPGRWRHVARDALVEAYPSWASLRAATRANLRLIPFQLEPALALTRGEACRFLIADPVGLGKTVEAGLMIAETLERRPEARALVISPAGLREQWREELRNRFGLEAEILDAMGVSRLAARLPGDVNPWAVQRLAITSIDYIKRPEVMRSLEALTWDLVVFDEAHNLAGRSDRAAAAAMLGHRARVLVMLTATPHSGDDEAFERLCRLGHLSSSDRLLMFRRSGAEAGLARSRRATLLRIRPTPAEMAMHEALIAYAQLVWSQSAGMMGAGARLAASVLARRACSSAAALARSVERRLALLAGATAVQAVQVDLPFADAGADDGEPDTLLGSPGLRDPLDERLQLERLLGLARAAASVESKIAALLRLISRIDEPAIVFTEYRDTLQQLATALGHVDTAQLHGGLTSRERTEALRQFTTGSARVLLATDAGSEGLNLHQRCRLVINLELPWTPLRLEQRAGRVDRIGQARRVHVVHLVAAGTCEESTLARLVRRIHRLRGTMSLFVDEQRVAESVLAHQPLPDLTAGPPGGPAGVVTLDLSREAREETTRMGLSRACLASGGVHDGGGRPVITRLRRHWRHRGGPECFWLFKLTFVNASGRAVWEALAPFKAGLARTAARSAALTRTLLDTEHPDLRALLRHTGEERLGALQASMQGALRRWSSRERDLAGALRARHARLSAGLLQRSLFDRRDERVAVSQALVLDQALSASETRLADLAACDDLRLDTCDLVFAVVLE